MKRIKKTILPMVILMVFVALMTTGGLLKKPLGSSDDVMGSIEGVEQAVLGGDWQQAEIDFQKVSIAWKKILFRIQLSIEQARIYEFESALALLKGSIVAKDSNSSIIATESLKVFWKQIGD